MNFVRIRPVWIVVFLAFAAGAFAASAVVLQATHPRSELWGVALPGILLLLVACAFGDDSYKRTNHS